MLLFSIICTHFYAFIFLFVTNCSPIKKLPIIIFTVFLFTNIYAQQSNLELYQNGYYIRQYTELSGLVNNKCKYVFEDSRGFLWISTFQGLSRFDGQRFTNYGLENGLPSINITQVCEDSLGFIYVATAKGIARYTGKQRANSDTCFYIYKATTNLSYAISGMQVIDSNNIVFQQIGGGLYLLKNKMSSVLWNGLVEYEMSVFKDSDHNIFLYAQDSFRVYNKYMQFQRSIFFPSSDYMTFYYDNNSHIFQAYSNGKTYQLNPRELSYSGKAPDSISWFWIAAGRKIYYSAGRNNLFCFDGMKKTKILDLTALSLSSNDLRQTKDGSIWMTTNSGGLFRIVQLPYQELIPQPVVGIKTINNRNMIDLRDAHQHAATISMLNSTVINTVFTDKLGNNWFCARNGIYMQEPGKQIVLYSFTGNEKLFAQRAKEIKGVAEDSNSNLWFYGYSGIILYSNKKFRQFTNQNGLSDDQLVRQLVIEKNGTVLLTDWYNLYRVRGESVITITSTLGLRNFIPNRIATDNEGSAWIDYNKKLYKIEKQPSENFSVTDSIIPNPLIPTGEITAFEFDSQNNCWVSYNGGSIKVFFCGQGGKYTFSNSVLYTIDDGISPATGGDFIFRPDAHGNMTLSTRKNGVDKVFIFNQNDAWGRKQIPASQVSIVEMYINQSTPNWNRLGYDTGPWGIPENPTLNYSSNDIAFTYKGSSMRNPGTIVYQVMLKGYNDAWITTTQTTANYTNLPPGHYSFIVKATNANGSWGNPFVYDFTILPPWYKTWWGKTLIMLLASSFIMLLFYQRLKAIRKKERLAHLEKSNQFNTVLISLLGHDIIIPLQYIGKVAAQLKNYNEKISMQTQLETLGDIHLTASQLQLYGESIIHWIKVQNSKFSPRLYQKVWVHDILEELLKFHQPLCAEKNNVLKADSQANITCLHDPLVIKIILHNLLINANKFTSNGNIETGYSIENNQLVLFVKDTGKGMSESKVQSLNNFKPLDSAPGTNEETGWGVGYIIIMDLLKYAKGSLYVESKLNEGTVITIHLPLSKPEENAG